MKIVKHSVLGAVLAVAATALAASPVQVTVDAARPGPVINKNIYGQFAEHLGSGVYGGLWVGPGSAIPNIRGWRKDVVGALKDLQVPVVRWPGGCFADMYHWRDGIGAPARRPATTNASWGGVRENNAVGTHEFFDLADQIGAATYVNGNLGSGTVQEMADWFEYMTANSDSPLARLRARNGHKAPFKLGFFGIGNEAWGCGGNMRPEHYADLYKQYANFLRAPKEFMPVMVASGGNDDDTSWSDHLSANIKEDWNIRFDAVTFHYYTTPNKTWDKKGLATGFGEDQWISTLQATLRMDSLIANNAAKLDKNDPHKRLSFIVDEWGTWYDPEPGTNPSFLVQQNSLRDAVVAALNFNIFHAHADRVRMTNIAQMVNVLQAMIMTDKDKMVLTPTYHAFKMYRPFQDATALPLTVADNPSYHLGQWRIPALSASAARARDGKLYVALVNTNPNQPLDVVLDLAGATAVSASATVLTAAAMDAHNTFAKPNAVAPAPAPATVSGGKLSVKLPAKAVMVVKVNE